GYGLAAALAAAGLARRRPAPTWPSGLLLAMGAAASAASVALALLSKLAIGAWCLLCAASWGAALVLLGAAWRACRPGGAAAAVRADLAVIRARPRRWAALALAGLAGIALLAAAYPRYWQKRPAAARPAAGAASGPPVVVEYSDYECPMCARAHEETKALLQRRPDVTLVRRHFPLDSSCNPVMKKPMHPAACALARAAICAEAQGRLAEMDGALFRNQEEGLPVPAIAERLGLDMGRFRECLGSPATERRLAADIAAAVRDGVKATPTFVVRGTAQAGRLPAELLPPPPAGR
ncbi:MAG TPA: thioredoxin domain-containing protein, partial [Anaeromyxobacteraceae bacterium]